jgi:hypothetical protein
MMKVYPCGYSVHNAQIAALMDADPALLLIDLRKNPDSFMAAWKRPYLVETYGERYGWFGETLGNRHYKTGGPIKLVNPEPGIAYLADLLHQGYNLLPFCGCASYELCHRRQVIDLLRLSIPEIEVIQPDQVEHPGMVKCLSIRHPWAWLICHPEALRACKLPIKDIENREWRPSYRGPLYIHAGTAVDASLFDPRSGKLESWYWERTFDSAGKALYAAMPKHKDAYPRRAIVGCAQLSDVLTESLDPWFVGPYGLRLANATAIPPISYPGQLSLFDVPASLIEER